MPKSLISLVRKENLDASLREAIEAIDGLPSLTEKKVLIKPNMNSSDPYPATSNPQLLRLLINIVKEKEPAEIIVADAANASYLPTIESMKQTGLYDAISDLEVTILGLENYPWRAVTPSKARNWKRMATSAILQEADFFISQCNVKTHFLANYSMALKNMMGLVDHRSRMSMHLSSRSKFWSMIAEISLVRKPDLVILDGIKAMVTGGPFTGEIRQANLISASSDPLSTDILGLAVLKTLGTTPQITEISPWDQPVLKRALELGIGATHPRDIELIDSGVEEIQQIRTYLAEPPARKAA